MRRREFITLIGGAAALAARGAGAAVGDTDRWSSRRQVRRLPIHRRVPQGLADAGFIEGQNVAIEFRLADGRMIVCRSWR